MTFEVREAGEGDEEAIAALHRASPDGGAVRFRVITHARESGGRSRSVVAVDGGRVVGAATVSLGDFRYAGQVRPYALLGSLTVDPGHRRQGIGAALARWRIECAEKLSGSEVVVLANIQKGNAGSLAAARRWATAFTSPAVSVPVPMRRRPPGPVDGLTFRSGVDDLTQIVDGFTAFTADHDFARVFDAESLRAWLTATPVPVPVHHYRVAVDGDGAVVAGLALREEGLLHTMQLVHMPVAIRVANVALRVVPKDGRLRNLGVEHLWFAPGRIDAARALWEDTRWSWRDRGTGLLVTVDPRSPAVGVLRLRPWTPTTSVTTAVRADPPLDPARIFAPLT
ncbi:GNAT family N-acetyltransferase [Flexivirga oryzae]|uniref:GNAT superfamily N-acetyltransferase n=1 Tax=Flexivirga oryzae TaxID=1794944 RepID=A0A839N7E8_9MICO|nr:GNAT family N-acetyltransferase [Flexivirga oryzae]MBB2891566.1 GNAT superfamily N-acetyltransferase [Flexivirga oryzae]